jgi:hypothetical protein
MFWGAHRRDGGETMKVLRIGSTILASLITAVVPIGNNLSAKPRAALHAEVKSKSASSIVLSAEDGDSSRHPPLPEEKASTDATVTPVPNSGDSAEGNSSVTAKPADVILESLRDVPIGTPLEEIERASEAFSVDFTFMKTIAKIESDFNPSQRTGSYIGLFQLSKLEFTKYGSGEITSPRDNAIAAAYKFATEAALFESDTGKKPTFSDLYLIHQQGWRGAAEHVSQPDRIAWKSMCATGEGREKGEKWCKRAIWLNTLPIIKRIWQSVDNLTSGAFIDMWRERVDALYALYAKAIPGQLFMTLSHQSARKKRGINHMGLKHVLRGRHAVG